VVLVLQAVALLMAVPQLATIQAVLEGTRALAQAVQAVRVLQEQVLVELQLAASVALVEYKPRLAELAEKEATVRAMLAQLV
jgi:hypothetical protein